MIYAYDFGGPEMGPKGTGKRMRDPVEWARTELGFAADELQAQVLRSGNRRGLLNCSRQWGKSTVTAAKAIYEACYREASLTLVVSPSARQSSEFLRKAEEFLRRLGMKPRGDGDNELSLAFPNGSRIVGLPGTEATVRGFSAVNLLLVDEASRVRDEMFQAIRPMLAVSNGAMWLMSTPYGKRGFFWEAWANGGPEWERVRAPAPECGRIAAEFLEGERATMAARDFRQEYLCEFEETAGAVFDMELVARAFTDEFEPLNLG